MSISQTDTTPIRIFIGSSPKNAIEEAVFRYSVEKNASAPVEFYSINGKTGSATNLQTREVKNLPNSLIERIPGATAFSLARWAIPEWCNYQGKAIYCDSDQVVLTDIAELWNYDVSGHTLAAVPIKKSKSHSNYRKTILKSYLEKEDELYLASVMVINCELATQINLAQIVDWKEKGDISNNYFNLMWLGNSFRERFQVRIKALFPEWNHLDWVDADSRLVHFTDLTSQPWKFHHNPVSDLWETLFLEALDKKFLTPEEVAEAHDQGWVTQRIVFLAKAPKLYRGAINSIWRNWKAFSYTATSLMQKASRRLQALNPMKHKGYA